MNAKELIINAKANAKANAKQAMKEARARVTSDTAGLKAERLTISATLVFIATSDSAEAEAYRYFLNLKKNANKSERKRVAAWLEPRWVNVLRKVYVSQGEESDTVDVVVNGVLPCTSGGAACKDILKAIEAVRKAYEERIANRSSIAADMWRTRAEILEISHETYMKSLPNILSYINRAPSKYVGQKIVGDRVYRN